MTKTSKYRLFSPLNLLKSDPQGGLDPQTPIYTPPKDDIAISLFHEVGSKMNVVPAILNPSLKWSFIKNAAFFLMKYCT